MEQLCSHSTEKNPGQLQYIFLLLLANNAVEFCSYFYNDDIDVQLSIGCILSDCLLSLPCPWPRNNGYCCS